MSGQTKEIRLRTQHQDKPWEQASLFDVLAEQGYWFSHMDEYVEAVAQFIRDDGDTLLELRWNYRGSPQGHYLKPKTVSA